VSRSEESPRDRRVAALLRAVAELASAGDRDDDPLTAAEAAVAAAAAELAQLRAHRARTDRQMQELFETINAYAALDYGRRVTLREGEDDITNAMALGLNMMGEELSHTMTQLVRARDAALAASRSKSTFLANMSHELRTPLNAIIGYAEIIREDLERGGTGESLRDISRVMAAARHLLLVIQDVLDLSRIEAGTLDIRPEAVDLRALLEELQGMLGPSLTAAGNHLRTRIELPRPVLWTDPLRLRQVLLNLLGNANKFTQDGEVTLAAHELAVEGAPWIELAVSDTGIGIPADKQGAVFEAFTQADDTTTRRFGGTGLGLTISRRLCEMLGGTIAVASEAGVGSTFTVRLPLRTPPD
jgi:signal transduction histidine kinase